MIPAHVSALDSAGHDVLRSDSLLEKGAPDEAVRDAARRENRVILTYDRTDFSDIDEHVGVLIATEDLQPRRLRTAVERVERAYPTLDGVTEFLSDWT